MIDFKKLGEILGKDAKFAEQFYNKLFELILDETRNPELNTIHLQDFGKFYVKKIKIDKIILAYIQRIRNNIGDPETNKEKIRSLWEARKGKSYKRI